MQKGQALVAQGVPRLDVARVACEFAVFLGGNASVREGDEARFVLVARNIAHQMVVAVHVEAVLDHGGHSGCIRSQIRTVLHRRIIES